VNAIYQFDGKNYSSVISSVSYRFSCCNGVSLCNGLRPNYSYKYIPQPWLGFESTKALFGYFYPMWIGKNYDRF
jgi:hypothetical protein